MTLDPRASSILLALTLVSGAGCQRDVFLGNPRPDGLAPVDGASERPTPRASWVVRGGGTGTDAARSIAIDRAGNIFLAGSFSGTAGFGEHTLTATHPFESFVARLDPDGRFLWVVSLGGTAKARPQALALDRDGNPYVVAAFGGTLTLGGTTLEATGPADLLVAKLDPDARVVWAVSAPRGAYDIEECNLGIAVDGAGQTTISGGYWNAASFGSTVLTSAGLQDVFVARLDSKGKFLWAATAGGEDVDRGNAVAVDEAGNSFVTGFFSCKASFGATLLDAGKCQVNIWGCFLAQLDAQGSFVRASTVSAPDSACNALAIGKGGQLAVTGTAGRAPFVAQFKPDGTIAWVRSNGFPVGDDRSPKRGNGIALDGAGAIKIAGQLAPYNSLTSDILVAGLDPAGEVLWSLGPGGSGEDLGNAIALDAAGTAYVAGSFSKTAKIGDETVSSAGNSDAFIWKLKAP